MARTLQQLKESIEYLIQHQGKDAPVAAFIFTKEHVVEMNEETMEGKYFSDDFNAVILSKIENTYYIAEKVNECISDEIHHLKFVNECIADLKIVAAK